MEELVPTVVNSGNLPLTSKESLNCIERLYKESLSPYRVVKAALNRDLKRADITPAEREWDLKALERIATKSALFNLAIVVVLATAVAVPVSIAVKRPNSDHPHGGKPSKTDQTGKDRD